MKIIICGAGQVGGQIARHLAAEGATRSPWSTQAGLIRRITDAGRDGVAGFASHPDILERAARATPTW